MAQSIFESKRMPGVCRGSLELYSAAIAAQNLASRSRIRPAKTRFPETSAGGASNTRLPFKPSPGLKLPVGGFVVLVLVIPANVN